MNRRDAIKLTPKERNAFLASQKPCTLCTHGPRGYPHAVAMWFDSDGESVWMTTYRKSQKAVNLRRNPKAAVSIESGVTYETLKGVMIRGDAEVIDEPEVVLNVLKRVHKKMYGAFPPGADEALRRQAGKRVAIKITPKRISSWDHAKLGSGY